MADGLEAAIRSVVANGNCSGCGGCTLISGRVSMQLDESGFLRPVVQAVGGPGGDDASESKLFQSICPGVSVRSAMPKEGRTHPTFGNYLDAWEGWATDPEVRTAGSSAGVLTALAAWMLASGVAHSVVGSGPNPALPSRTVPVRITTREEALASAGSRYAPVANLEKYDASDSSSAFVGKPCEVTAASQLHSALGRAESELPILLSFFCAGTPSQRATDSLSELMGVHPSDLATLKYRGDGWPGDFVVTSKDGRSERTSYDNSWGKHLGRDLQWRCKICVDGTGGHSDISVGDYWKADASGYPTFENADGVSVIIARTPRGQSLLAAAAAAGVVSVRRIDIDSVARIQPLQRERKETLLGRLAGRLLAGKRIPRYSGFHLFALAARHPKTTLRAVVGTFRRSIGFGSRSR